MFRVSFAGLIPALLLAANAAAAAPVTVPGLPGFPPQLSARCAPLSRIPDSALIPEPQLAARVSVANCVAEEAMNALALSPDEASVRRLGAAVEPSIALLDAVIATGDPYWQVIAEDAKRDLYIGMVVRERISIPSADPSVHAALEPMISPWLTSAETASERIAAITAANPALAKQDPVISGAIARAAEERKSTQMARAPGRR